MITLLDRNVSIHRLSAIDSYKSAYTTLTTTIESTIQPLADEKAAQFGGSSGKLFVIYMDVNKNVNEGDQVRDKNGNIYKVLAGGISNRDDGLIADYMSVTVTKIN